MHPAARAGQRSNRPLQIVDQMHPAAPRGVPPRPAAGALVPGLRNDRYIVAGLRNDRYIAAGLRNDLYIGRGPAGRSLHGRSGSAE